MGVDHVTSTVFDDNGRACTFQTGLGAEEKRNAFVTLNVNLSPYCHPNSRKMIRVFSTFKMAILRQEIAQGTRFALRKLHSSIGKVSGQPASVVDQFFI